MSPCDLIIYQPKSTLLSIQHINIAAPLFMGIHTTAVKASLENQGYVTPERKTIMKHDIHAVHCKHTSPSTLIANEHRSLHLS